jgi:hypothetical protein
VSSTSKGIGPNIAGRRGPQHALLDGRPQARLAVGVRDLFMMDPLLWICLVLGILLIIPWQKLRRKR